MSSHEAYQVKGKFSNLPHFIEFTSNHHDEAMQFFRHSLQNGYAQEVEVRFLTLDPSLSEPSLDDKVSSEVIAYYRAEEGPGDPAFRQPLRFGDLVNAVQEYTAKLVKAAVDDSLSSFEKDQQRKEAFWELHYKLNQSDAGAAIDFPQG